LTARTWRQLTQASAVPGYGYRYRRWVLDSLKYVDARDLATGGDHVPELGDVYVDVGLVSRAQLQRPGAAAGLPGDNAPERHSISELLGNRSRVVIALAGQPGSGKSTVLAYAARRTAARPVRGLGAKRVPVLLALHEHAESIVADPAISLPAVARAAAAGRPGREPGGWWERQLGRGRCLVLLDGLDEVARADDRSAVADWVGRQIAGYPRNHFVVTSRPYGLPGSLTDQADVYVIRPFTAEQVQLFLDRWYLAAEQHATGASGRTARRAVRVRAGESAARLDALLREYPALHDLAVNPLLLTMIAAAHRYRGALPASRADLYAEICRVLLSRRAQPGELPELLSWPAKQTLLAVLAYQMMREHVANLPAARVLDILGPLAQRFASSVTGAAFLDDIAHSGLLVEASAGRYAFSHLTFQEYLAARHVTANPELVKTLADNVDEPWWHETILLYAATADASPIVRACLDSGTIPALTLAFDCSEASAEIDPELRRHLERERERAYQPGCSAEHRRLIAGVQAARLVRRTLTTAAGTRVCAGPVPADLYWLFLADTQAPRPDSPCEPGTGQPAIGIWGTEAQAFVSWLNSITATAAGLEVRLPRHDELPEEAIAGPLSRQLPAPATGAWTAPPLALWLRRGQPDPHELPGASIQQAVAADAKNTALLPQVLTAAVLDVALKIIRDLEDARALSRALDDDLATRAQSDGHLVDLMHAHVHAIALTYAHALKLTRADTITRSCAAGPGLVDALGLGPARALADAIAGELAAAIDRAHTRAVELAKFVDLDLSVLSAFDFDVPHAVELHRVHTYDLDRAHVLARGTLHDPELGLASVLGLASAGGLEPALPLPAILGLPLRWVADGPLTGTLLQVLAAQSAAPARTSDAASAQSLPADPHLAFALALSSHAGIAPATPLRAALGSPLTDQLRELTAAASRKDDHGPDWNQATALGRLTDACAPICGAHTPPGPAQAAALRAVALALAGDADLPNADAAALLRTVAATVTVVENRSGGRSVPGESVILAVV
jgi:hypothetical protein